MVKLLSYDLEIMGSSHRNNRLQSKIRPSVIDPSLGPCIGRSFVHQAALFFLY